MTGERGTILVVEDDRPLQDALVTTLSLAAGAMLVVTATAIEDGSTVNSTVQSSAISPVPGTSCGRLPQVHAILRQRLPCPRSEGADHAGSFPADGPGCRNRGLDSPRGRVGACLMARIHTVV